MAKTKKKGKGGRGCITAAIAALVITTAACSSVTPTQCLSAVDTEYTTWKQVKQIRLDKGKPVPADIELAIETGFAGIRTSCQSDPQTAVLSLANVLLLVGAQQL